MEEKKKKGLLSFLIENVPEEKEPAHESVKASTTSTPSSQPSVDDEIKKELESVLTECNLPGPDYYEFKESEEEMRIDVPAEPQRYKATFRVFSKMGVTSEKLVDGAKYYIKKLQEHKAEFLKYLEKINQEKVIVKQSKAKDIDSQVTQKKEQIAALSKEIAALQEQQTVLLNEASIEKAKNDKASASFEMTFKVVVDSIEQDITKIQTYLKS